MLKKKLVIALPHLMHGGSERAASELANYFLQVNIETFILLMYIKPKSFDLNENIKIIEPPATSLNIPKVIYPFYLIKYLRQSIKDINPDCVLAFGYKTYTIISCIGLKVRLIDSLRTSPTRIRFPDNKAMNAIYNLNRKLINNRIDGIIAQTERARIELSKKHNCEIVQIPNSLRNIEKYDVKRQNIILSVGRLSVEKGHRFLIEAFAGAHLKDWKLKLLGDGPQKKNLVDLTEKLGISESVVFEGFKQDVDYYMQEAKIFVLPSLIEGFPNALLESMANGLACISFDCDSGPAEIIDHERNGLLVQTKDVSMLTFYLKKLAECEVMRISLGQEAMKVKMTYDKDIIGRQYIDFLFKD